MFRSSKSKLVVSLVLSFRGILNRVLQVLSARLFGVETRYSGLNPCTRPNLNSNTLSECLSCKCYFIAVVLCVKFFISGICFKISFFAFSFSCLL